MLKNSRIVFLSMLLITNMAAIAIGSPETITPPKEQKTTETQSETSSNESETGDIEFNYKDILQMQRDLAEQTIQAQQNMSKQIIQVQQSTSEQVIQAQQSTSMYILVAVIFLAGLLAGGSWFTNFHLIRRNLIKVHEDFDSNIDNMKKEYEEFTTNIKNELSTIENKVNARFEKSMRRIEGETERISALHMVHNKKFDIASVRFARAIMSFAAAEEHAVQRACIDALVQALCDSDYIEEEHRTYIRNCIRFIPESFKKEIDHINNRMHELPKEKPKKSNT